MNITHESIVYTYKTEHGGWYQDPAHEWIGTQVIPAKTDGTPDYDNVGDIEMSYYESGGVCEARCALCEYHEAEWILSEARNDYEEAYEGVRRAHEHLTAVNSKVQ